MSGSLSPSWIKPVVLYMLDQKGEYNAKFEKQYLGSKTVQVIRIFKDMCAIEVSDKSSSIVVSVSESCMKYLRTQDSFKNLPALRNAVLQLKTWHISTITQCFSLKDLRRSMDHGMTLPMCIRCDKIELLGGDDCIIFGDPYDINQNKDIKTILSKQINYSNLDGNIIGEHEGAHYFTIGQRKGLAIGGYNQPLFIIGTNTSTNEIFFWLLYAIVHVFFKKKQL
mgnify:CR=1 FL=1